LKIWKAFGNFGKFEVYLESAQPMPTIPQAEMLSIVDVYRRSYIVKRAFVIG